MLESVDPFPSFLANMLKRLVKSFLAMGCWVHLPVLLKLVKLFPLDVLVVVSPSSVDSHHGHVIS